MRPCYVYIIKQIELGFNVSKEPEWIIKIGHSYNPERRVYSFRDSIRWAELIIKIKCLDKKSACLLERSLHKRFKNDLLFSDTREWFRFSNEIRSYLQSHGVNNESNL